MHEHYIRVHIQSNPELSIPERSEATTSSELAIATCILPAPAIHEAHSIVTNNRGTDAPPAAKTRQRKMGVTSAPEIPLELPPPRPEPQVVTNWIPTIQTPNIRQSNLRVGEDTVCHRQQFEF